jgi:hypothetical protein
MQADAGRRQLHVQSDGVDPQHRPTSETTGTPFDQEAAPSRRENQHTPRPVAPSARVIDPAIGGHPFEAQDALPQRLPANLRIGRPSALAFQSSGRRPKASQRGATLAQARDGSSMRGALTR